MITIVQSDDWSGLYIDGELKYEAHDITPSDVLDTLGMEYESRWIDPDWEYLQLPERLEDLDSEWEI